MTTDRERYQTCETTQPWVVYTYPRTDAEADRLGEALIVMQCAVCGVKEEWRAPLPPAGAPDPAPGYKHPDRIAFLAAHDHRPLPHAITWALPLLSPDAHQETLDVLETIARKAVEETSSDA